ncbi:MAG TPA: hypothetical protein VLU43_08250 [Anaeromyxobacteraceae bacterium]|nr:hypothetical protein [Anaeromyxobacteraceae bacterium]
MRTALALALAALFTVLAAAPHVHAGPRGVDECATCAVRDADVARSEIPDLAPPGDVTGEPPAVSGPAPVTGAPLGAIPGQSPPAA